MITVEQLELLEDIFGNTQRLDMICIYLDQKSRSIIVKYEDIDDEWYNEMQELTATN